MPTVWRGNYVAEDPDAAAYLDLVEAADGQSLESATRTAVNTFVEGCKSDGIWDAIKASCIMAGARTLDGALVPLVGTAPDRFGTEGNWNYDRKTGLEGDGSTNYVSSNRNNNTDPRNSKHLSVYVTAGSSGSGETYIGVDGGYPGASGIFRVGAVRLNTADLAFVANPGVASGLFGGNRSELPRFTTRYNGVNQESNIDSNTASDRIITVFAMDNLGSMIGYTSDRLSFYSIGESLDLELLDTRVSTLMTDLAAAIP